jgi:hypothetical protein
MRGGPMRGGQTIGARAGPIATRGRYHGGHAWARSCVDVWPWGAVARVLPYGARGHAWASIYIPIPSIGFMRGRVGRGRVGRDHGGRGQWGRVDMRAAAAV